MIKPVCLTVPQAYQKTMGRLFLTYARYNLLRLFPYKYTLEEMLNRFEIRYRSGEIYGDFMDGATSWYLSPLDHYEPVLREVIPNDENILALDLGPEFADPLLALAGQHLQLP